MLSTRFILIRHGQSTWNVEERLAGSSDIPLTKRGKKEAEYIANYLAQIPIHAAYFSPLKRAKHTALTILRKHTETIRQESILLIERQFGELEGKSYSEVNAFSKALIFSEAWKYPYYQPPGGERLIDVVERSKTFLTQARCHHRGKTVAVVSHGVFLNCLISELLSLPVSSMSNFRIVTNTGLTIIDETEQGIHVQLLGNTTHLDDENS